MTSLSLAAVLQEYRCYGTMITLRLSNTNYRALMDALKKCAYDTNVGYNDRLPYLNAYKDIEYRMKMEERRNLKKKI